MEWLIIYRKEEEVNAQKVSTVLARYGIEASVLETGEVKNLEDENINLKIKTATHVIIYDNLLLKDDSICFFYGYLVAKAIKLYTLQNEWSGNMKYFKNVSVFAGAQEMLDKIESQIDEIKVEDKSRTAFSDLFNEGIPFTADCFAYHVGKDNRDICQKFIDAGIDVNCKTSEGIPMLNVAVRSNNSECVKWLLTFNVNIDEIANDRGYSAVMDAVWKNNIEIAKILVEKGARLDFISRDGQSVLVLAVGAGKEDMCRLLVEAGADPDIKDEMGMSAYEYAKLFKRNDIVDILDKYHKD
ncbi:MAG: ankyrin repeat domain-containing protein [Treponema sp.]|nr:ankyrin repeat domain-containing protein [Treponema sp.]